MAHEPTITTRLDDECLFRFHIVSMVRALEMHGMTKPQAVVEIAGDLHMTADGGRRRVSSRSIYRWLTAYDTSRIDGLRSNLRATIATSKVLPADFVDFIQSEKQEDPAASVPELIRRAKERGILGPTQRIDRTTVWRACRRMMLPTQQRPHKHEADTRRYAHPHRMSVVLCDGKHFRAGPTRQKRVALTFLDDATRYALHGVVSTSENTVAFLRGFYDSIRSCGLADIYYLDKGPSFISDDTATVIASLPFAHLVHGKTAYPQGHGKIEKYHQILIRDVLRSLDGALDVDPDCGALSLRLQHYLARVYNHRPHEGIDGDTPAHRWQTDRRPLRFPNDDDELRQHFIVSHKRTVSNDHVISYEGTAYEAPRGTARTRITLYRHVYTGELWVPHDAKLVRLHPVDLHANATDRRATASAATEIDDHKPPPKTAATLAYERDYGPIVSSDGGFSDPKPHKE